MLKGVKREYSRIFCAKREGVRHVELDHFKEVFNLTHDRKFDFELIKEYEDFLDEMTSGALT